MPSRDYPDKRTARGLAKDADLKMLSARVETDLMEYVRITRMKRARASRRLWQKR
jgi:hypothetical protein